MSLDELRVAEEPRTAIYRTSVLRSPAQLYNARRTLIGESVSWRLKTGQAVSWRPDDGVPEGKLWQLQSIYVRNAESQPNLGTFLLLDQDGTDHARFGPPGQPTPFEVPPGTEMGWTGLLTVPAGWSVGVRFEDMAGEDVLCHWRYTAIET